MPDGAQARALLGPGCLFLVVGPSGAGKDSLIGYARKQLNGGYPVRFPRRVITRQADGGAEDHEGVSELEFASMLAAGHFALHWRAHGLAYGIPAEVDSFIAAGDAVVVNVSRSIVAEARCRFAAVQVVSVVAPAAVLAERLRSRGREAAADVQHRLARSDLAVDLGPASEILNDGPLAEAGERLVSLIQERL